MIYDPEVETLPSDERRRRDDALYRDQVAYLFAASPFYRSRLKAAGFPTPESVGGLDGIAALPLTEKDEIRATRNESNPVGDHFCVGLSEVVRVFSTSGTTGLPSFIPLTARDLQDWTRISARSYSASGLSRGEGLISTYGAGPFVAGVTFDSFNAIGVCHIPVGAGNTERLMIAIKFLKPSTIALTPSYALHLAEWARDRGFDTRGSSIRRLVVAGEPGGGEPAMRAQLERLWGASVTEVMGIGDIAASLWGECEEKQGMHFGGGGFVHFEVIDPESGRALPIEDGVEGEVVYTHLRQQAVPQLRFRSRDHIRVWTGRCACGRTAPRVRCIGRTDDMLIVRGVNVFPSAIREIVSEFAPAVSGVIAVRPRRRGFRQDPPLRVVVEEGLGLGDTARADLADRIRKRVREALLVTTEVELAPIGSLPRSDYKSKLVDWSDAADGGAA